MATIHIDENKPLGRIAPEIYGHFSEHLGRCIYGGIFVKPDSGIPNVNGMRTDVAEALKEIRMPVLRWPGGCFVNEYHWKDGIGPKESRKRMVNTHWGGVVEDNSFGPHKFFEIGGGRTAPPSAPEVRPLSGTGRRWGRSGSRFCT